MNCEEYVIKELEETKKEIKKLNLDLYNANKKIQELSDEKNQIAKRCESLVSIIREIAKFVVLKYDAPRAGDADSLNTEKVKYLIHDISYYEDGSLVFEWQGDKALPKNMIATLIAYYETEEK